MNKFEVRADLARNRLYILANGFFTDSEIFAATNQIRSKVDQLKPGFISIADFVNFKPATSVGFEAIRALEVYIAVKGVKKRIQIQPASQVAQMQMQRSAAGTGVAEMLPVSSLAEADRLADSL